MLRSILSIIIMMLSINFSFANDFKTHWQNEGGSVKEVSQDEKEPEGSSKNQYEVFTPNQLVWEDHLKPFNQPFRVCRRQRALVSVKLPKAVVDNKKEVTLVIDLESGVITVTDGLKQKNFQLITPYVSINDAAFFGKYRIPVNIMNDRQVRRVKISHKYLKPGINTLEFIPGSVGAYRESGTCFGFYVHNLKLEQDK